MSLFFTCWNCGDYLVWVDDEWFCPNCEKEIIEKRLAKKPKKVIGLSKEAIKQIRIRLEEMKSGN